MLTIASPQTIAHQRSILSNVFFSFFFFLPFFPLLLWVVRCCNLLCLSSQNVIILSVITLFIIPKYLRHSLYFGLFWACHLIESNAMGHKNFNCRFLSHYTLHILYQYRVYHVHCTLNTFGCKLLGHVLPSLPRSFRIMRMQEETGMESIKLNDNNCNVWRKEIYIKKKNKKQ